MNAGELVVRIREMADVIAASTNWDPKLGVRVSKEDWWGLWEYLHSLDPLRPNPLVRPSMPAPIIIGTSIGWVSVQPEFGL